MTDSEWDRKMEVLAGAMSLPPVARPQFWVEQGRERTKELIWPEWQAARRD